VKRILFVDDEPSILDGLKRALRAQRNGGDMVFASSGPAALELLATGPCDVVVSDMRMPGMDGAAFLAAVCERYPATARIILTGYTELDASVRAAPVAQQFLLKPCDPGTLTRVIEQQIATLERFHAQWVTELVGSVRTIPVAPRAYKDLGELTGQPNASVDQIANVVERDVGISAKVLQLANSAFFGRPRDVADIRMAVSYLGGNLLRQLTGEGGIFRRFDSEAAATGCDIEGFEWHCVLTGAIASKLAIGDRPPQILLVAGVLHDIGKLVIADRAPDRFRHATATARTQNRQLYAVEAELFGVSHAEVGACLLGSWGLPTAVVEAVAHHHHPGRAAQDVRDVAAAVCLANRLAYAHDTVADVEHAAVEGAAMDPAVLAVLGGAPRLPEWTAMAAEIAARLPAPGQVS
jgi:putative nucleotidyltransferase with HDIG domain